MQFEEALAHLSTFQDPYDPMYLVACETVAGNLGQLSYRVFIHLPGGLNGNSDPAWIAVKAASTELCSCGNERVFEPLDMRHEFEPSLADPIVMTLGSTLYVRPVGAPASAAYARIEVIETPDGPTLTIMLDPMSTVINFASLLSGPKGCRLADLVEPLRHQDDPAVFVRDLKHVKRVPIAGIAAVDPDVGTVTIVLDAAVEAFDPTSEVAHTH